MFMSQYGKQGKNIMPTLIIDGETIECNLTIFDMDGTLIDVNHRFESLARVRKQVMKKMVGDYSTELWAKASGINPITGRVELEGALAIATRSEDLMVAATSIAISGESWNEAKRISEKIYSEADKIMASTYKPVLLPGIRDLLTRLKDAGFILAIATNAPNVSAEDAIESVNLTGVFKTIIGADDVVNSKPSPDMILLACERCGCIPDEAVYVGDKPTDMEAGRRAGVLAVIAVKSDFFVDSGYSDYDVCIDSYDNIITS